MHTDEVSNCGRIPAREGVRLYHEMGFKGICITDHFCESYFNGLGDISWHEKIDCYLKGYREALDEGKRIGIKVILAMEYTFQNTVDDILVFGFNEQFLYDHEELGLFNIDVLKKLKEDYNILLIQAHPFRKKITRTYDDLVEGFEVFNGNARHDSKNNEVEEYAKRSGCIMISGSDFHQLEDAGNGGVYLPQLPEDSYELANILRNTNNLRLVRNDRESHGK
jgi:predicted metal-dependent phosphoesterase TrpH